MPRSHILLRGLQVKSLAKAKKLAAALNVIEVECGIRSVRITVEDVFMCPWIDLKKLNRTPMEKLLAGVLQKVR